MHIADPETGSLGAYAIVGGSASIATGALSEGPVIHERIDSTVMID